MSDHRIRLTDDDLRIVVAALSARAAMTRGLRRHRIERLVTRLSDAAPGNPRLRFDDFGQTQEDELDAEDVA